MDGDTAVMRRRADQLREQGTDIRAAADRLVARSEAPNRLTVVFDRDPSGDPDQATDPYVLGARAADAAAPPVSLPSSTRSPPWATSRRSRPDSRRLPSPA